MTRNSKRFHCPLARSIADVSKRYLSHEGAGLLIAATALKQDLPLVTRNVRHFEATDVPVLGPIRPAQMSYTEDTLVHPRDHRFYHQVRSVMMPL